MRPLILTIVFLAALALPANAAPTCTSATMALAGIEFLGNAGPAPLTPQYRVKGNDRVFAYPPGTSPETAVRDICARTGLDANVALGLTSNTVDLTVPGDVYANGFYPLCDKARKKNILRPDRTADFDALSSATAQFQYDTDSSGTTRLGFIAQELPATLRRQDAQSRERVDLVGVTMVLTQKIAALGAEIEALKKKGK